MISHHHRCVFVHIPKNAGQSVEHVFLRLLGLTWETRAPLLLRHNDVPELGPPSLAHLTAEEYVRCKYMTQEQFNDYFKFSFVRNPWARVVSMWKYLGYSRRTPFQQFATRLLGGEVWRERYWFVRPQSDFIADADGKLAVNFVGRFEHLQADFDVVCSSLGLERQIAPHINDSKTLTETQQERGLLYGPKQIAKSLLGRGERTFPHYSSFRDYYDDSSVNAVAELYRRDIELFGYSSPDVTPATPLRAA